MLVHTSCFDDTYHVAVLVYYRSKEFKVRLNIGGSNIYAAKKLQMRVLAAI